MAENEEELKPQPTAEKPYCSGGSNCTTKKEEIIDGNPRKSLCEDLKEGYDDVSRSLVSGWEQGTDAAEGAINGAIDGFWGTMDFAADLWMKICDHEVASMNAIGGFLYDSAEEIANDENVNVDIRNLCHGIVGDEHTSVLSGGGAFFAGVGNFVKNGWNGAWTFVGHPLQTTLSIAEGGWYAVNHMGEVAEGIGNKFEEFQGKNPNEQIAIGVETLCNTVLIAKAAKELGSKLKGLKNLGKGKSVAAKGGEVADDVVDAEDDYVQ